MNSNITLYRLSIFFIVVAVLGHAGVWAQVTCYQCVWMYDSPLSTGALPSTIEVSDVCRPQNFNPNIVHKDVCPQGCITTILYEHDPDIPSTTTTRPTRRKSNNTTTTTTTTTTPKPAKPPMTFFFRGCPKNDLLRSKSGCEEKSFQKMFQDECFCTTDLCNGESSGWSARMMGNKGIVTLGCLFISFIINPTNSIPSLYLSSHFS